MGTMPTMKLWSDSFSDGAAIPVEFAMGKHNAETHSEFSDNKNPHFAWSDVPDGAKSLVMVCVDVDAPSTAENVNKEGVSVAFDLPRGDFYHWVLVDIATDVGSFAVGECCDGVTAKGKAQDAAQGRRGLNNYTQWFDGNADMGGNYFGYDGPYPPWNDERLHHYHFTLYALDVATLKVDGAFSATDAIAAMDGHIVGKASMVGSYAVNPDAK